jgi:hypothetical protein
MEEGSVTFRSFVVLIFMCLAGVCIALSDPMYQWPEGPVPAQAIAAADSCVRACVGDSLFEAYLRRVGGGSFGSCCHRVTYEFAPAGADTYSCRVSLAVDDQGHCRPWLSQPNWNAIPDCAAHPEWCRVLVSARDAVEAAESAGLSAKSGIQTVELGVGSGQRKLVWLVSRSIPRQAGPYRWVFEVDAVTGVARSGATQSMQFD